MESFLSSGRWLWSLMQRMSKKLSCVGATGFLIAAHVIVFFTRGAHWFSFFVWESRIGVSAYLWMPFTSVSCVLWSSSHRNWPWPRTHWEPQKMNHPKKVALSVGWPAHPKAYILGNTLVLYVLLHLWLEKLQGKKKHQARAWPHSCHLLTVKVKETHWWSQQNFHVKEK